MTNNTTTQEQLKIVKEKSKTLNMKIKMMNEIVNGLELQSSRCSYEQRQLERRLKEEESILAVKKKREKENAKRKKEDEELQKDYGINTEDLSSYKNENLTHLCECLRNIKEQHGSKRHVRNIISKALRNYNMFYKFRNANILMVHNSSAGIRVWGECDFDITKEQLRLNHMKEQLRLNQMKEKFGDEQDEADEAEAEAFDVTLNAFVDEDTGYYKTKDDYFIYNQDGDCVGEMVNGEFVQGEYS